jgi:DHA1 family bicyclomycin/chloramphenicol resistance-like MFS transporter
VLLDKDSRAARLILPVLLAACSMLGPFSIDTAFPAFEVMGEDFTASVNAMQWVVSAYLFSFGLMSVFHGPLSDALGRKPVMIGGIGVYVLASVGCALSPTLGAMIAFRSLQGLSAGGGVIVSRTLVRDLYDGPQAQKLMATVMMIFGLAPAIAPIVGGWILNLGSWQLIFWFLTGYGVLLILAVWLLLPETHPKSLRTPFTAPALLAELLQVSRSARFHRMAWSGILLFAGWFIYIGAAAIVVFDLLHKGSDDFWILFVPLIGGVVLGAWVSGRAAGRIPDRTLISIGVGLAVIGGVINLAVSGAGLPWVVLAPAVCSFGASMAYPSVQIALFDMFPRARGAAASGFTFGQLLVNSMVAVALVPLIDASSTTMALACLIVLVAAAGLWLWTLRVDLSVD